MGGVLIHVCAKIATDGGGAVSVADVVLIHACAKIATGASAGLWSSFLIHACARIATVGEYIDCAKSALF